MVEAATTETEEPELEPQPLPESIGKYRILCELGQGGMASLYLGRAQGPGGFERLFAIKLIHEHLSREPQFVRMFLDEARIAARIQHPNVVSVYEVGVEQGRHFLAMDYVNGETLAFVLSQVWQHRGPFPIPLMAFMIMTACEGLHAAHELKNTDGAPLGVIHRDVAPSNLMLGYDGIIQLMDFGVAKAKDQISHTKPGTVKGTLAYMAPEHVASKAMDRRADIFSLGVILWEGSVGRRLFKGRNDIETTARLLRCKVPPPSTIRSEVPGALEEIIVKAASKEPEDRYANTREMGTALSDYLASQGKRIGASDVEQYMLEVFPDRHKRRLEIERTATTGAPGDVQLLYPQIDISASFGYEELPTAEGEELTEDEKQGALDAIDNQLAAIEERLTTGDLPAPDESPTELSEKPGNQPVLYEWAEKAAPKDPANAETSGLRQALTEVRKATRNTKPIAVGIVLAVFVGAYALVDFGESDTKETELAHTKEKLTKVEPEQPGKASLTAEKTKIEVNKAKTPLKKEKPRTEKGTSPVLGPVELTFEVEPANATVLVGDETIEGSGTITLARSKHQVAIEITAPGYRDVNRLVRANRSETFRIKLKRKRKGKRKKKKKKKDQLLLIEGGEL